MERNSKQTFYYAFKYQRLLLEGFGELHAYSKSKRGNVLKALANLSKFLNCYDLFKQQKERSGIKWQNESGLEIFSKIYNNNAPMVEGWLIEVAAKLPRKYSFPIIFQALTGLRPSEAVASLNIIARNGLKGYFNSELSALEHFRYPETFLRRTKNAFFSFVSPRLEEQLRSWNIEIPKEAIRLKLKRSGLGVRLQDLRSNYATVLREAGVPKEAIDMVQGRIGQDVFARFYYKPYLQQLKEKILESIRPLEEKINIGLGSS